MTCPICKCETHMTVCPQCGGNTNHARMLSAQPGYYQPCGICGEPVLWSKSQLIGPHPVQYHDCKPVPGAKLDAALERNARLVAVLKELLDSQHDPSSEYFINTNAGCYIAEVLAENGGAK